MESADKVAWILIRDGRVLVARNEGRTLFYFPGGARESGETDMETLTREVDEELSVRIVADTVKFVGTCVAPRDGRPESFRLTCYAADYRGTIQPANEIAEIAWLRHADQLRVSEATGHFFELLYEDGRLS
jgi:8-oxo-dGTP pyrophosphatase MutT (NUDIX family)